MKEEQILDLLKETNQTEIIEKYKNSKEEDKKSFIEQFNSLEKATPGGIKDYLKRNNRLSFYTKAFAKSGYTTNDLKNDIENNKTQIVDNKKIYLKEILRESDLVTLTIGANNYLKYLNIDKIYYFISSRIIIFHYIFYFFFRIIYMPPNSRRINS